MTPEIKVSLFAAAVMIFAYTVIYPGLREKAIMVMATIDLALTAAILLLVGVVYHGLGVGFSVIFFEVPWWLYTFLSTALFEAPLFVWFCKRWNIDLNPSID
jgi:hypothetical protein